MTQTRAREFGMRGLNDAEDERIGSICARDLNHQSPLCEDMRYMIEMVDRLAAQLLLMKASTSPVYRERVALMKETPYGITGKEDVAIEDIDYRFRKMPNALPTWEDVQTLYGVVQKLNRQVYDTLFKLERERDRLNFLLDHAVGISTIKDLDEAMDVAQAHEDQ